MSNQHVVPNKNGKGWAVKGEGNSKYTKITSTKSQAVTIARGIAKNQKSELIIHNMDGTISDKDSYGGDPNPPKDMVH